MLVPANIVYLCILYIFYFLKQFKDIEVYLSSCLFMGTLETVTKMRLSHEEKLGPQLTDWRCTPESLLKVARAFS